MADLQGFIDRYNGQQGIGDTPQNDGQCVGLVEAWLDTIGAPHIWGNACDLAANADTNAYVVTPNSFEYVPALGDLGTLPAGWGGSSVGHCFIVAPGTTQETLVVFEQNDRIGGGDGACRIFDDIGWPAGLTFIHPKVLDLPVPEPVPVPVPTPAPSTPAVPTPVPVPTSEPVPSVPAPPVPTPSSESPSAPVPSPSTPPSNSEPTPSAPSVQAHPFWEAFLNLVSEFFNLFKRKQ